MARPLITDVHIDRALTNMSIRYSNENYIADSIFPRFRVTAESDKFFKWDKNNAFRVMGQTLRAISSGYRRVEFQVGADSYVAQEYGLEAPLDDRMVRAADPPLQIRRTFAEELTNQISLDREKRARDLAMTTANWTTTNAGSAAWDVAGTDVIGDVKLAQDTIRKLIGRVPRHMVIGWELWRNLQVNTAILAAYNNVIPAGGALLTPQLVAKVLDLDEIIVGRAVINTAKEGATDTIVDIWGDDDALVFYKNPTIGVGIVTAGVTFDVNGRKVSRYREEQTTSDVIRVAEILVEKPLVPDCGATITGLAT